VGEEVAVVVLVAFEAIREVGFTTSEAGEGLEEAQQRWTVSAR
jgi:hypothetical protein